MKLSKYTLLYILLVGIVILTGCSDHLFDDENRQKAIASCCQEILSNLPLPE